MKDVNDSDEDATRLAKLLRPIKAKINLIPFNEHEGSDFRRPENSDVLKFQKIMRIPISTEICIFGQSS